MKTTLGNSILRSLLTCGLVMASIGPARADQDSEAKALAEAQDACAFFNDETKEKNCVAAFDEIPNRDAVLYTLAYMKENMGRLADGSCLEEVKAPAQGTDNGNVGITKQFLIDNGIQNSCQFVINDVLTHYKGMAFRSNAYFVDVCDSQHTVTAFYMNKGTGTTNAFLDINDRHSTNVGAYLTSNYVFDFHPYDAQSAPYKNLRRQAGGKIPAVRLYGALSTNNNTSDSKPLHASPFKSSWGCPSVDVANHWMIEKLAKNGPSLVMNYGPESMLPLASVKKCDAVPEQSAPAATHRVPGRAPRTRRHK